MASSRDDLILEGEFVLPKKTRGYYVTLTRSCLFYHQISNTSVTYEEKYVQISDIVGCHCMDSNGGSAFVPSDVVLSSDFNNSEVTNPPIRTFPATAGVSACGFVIFAYPFRKKLFSSKKVRSRKVVAFEISSSHVKDIDEKRNVAETWRNVINCLSRGLSVNMKDIPSCVPPPRGKMLFLINPFSGSGKACAIFRNEVAPVLYEADIPYKVLVTEHAGHAGELMKTVNLSEWYGVVIVSGDGLIFEAVNGIMQRDDWASSIKHPVGCLPGGSGNALCCSINYSAGEPLDSMILHSTFILIKHRVVPMDLVVLHVPSRTIFSFLSVTWGIMADVDFESEKYRKLGEARFTVGAIKRIIGLRSYRGRISFLPVAEYIPKVSSGSSKVLSKVRRLSLSSQSSSSKSTINSVDSKSSNSAELLSYSRINGVQDDQQSSYTEVNAQGDSFVSVDLKTPATCSVGADGCGGDERCQGHFLADSRRSVHNKDGISIDNEDVTTRHIQDGGDADTVNTADVTVSNRVNSAFQQPQDSKSAKTKNVPCGQIHQDDRSEGELINGSKVLDDQQQQNSGQHSSNDHVVNGYGREHSSCITILSETQEVKVRQETYHGKKADFCPVPTPLLPPLDKEVPSNWVTLDDSFISAAALYQTHLGSDMFAAPDAHLSDGLIHLIIVKEGIPRNALLNLFLSFSEGKHVNSPYVDVVKVLAFRFEPASSEGNLMVDGERFDPTPIQGQILPGLARIMAIK